MRQLRALIIFFILFFIFTTAFYTLTPALWTLLDAFESNIDKSAWSSNAVSTWNTVITLARYGWIWSCVLSLVGTLIWYYLTPYREEVLTDVER